MVKVLPSCRVMVSMEKYSTLRLLLPPSLLSSSSSSSSSMLMSMPPRLLVTCTKPCREQQQWFQKKNDSLSSTKMNVFKRMFQKHECSKTWIITSKGISTSICEKWLWKVMYIWSHLLPLFFNKLYNWSSSYPNACRMVRKTSPANSVPLQVCSILISLDFLKSESWEKKEGREKGERREREGREKGERRGRRGRRGRRERRERKKDNKVWNKCQNMPCATIIFQT